jgi:hypothetical protein
VVVISRRFLVAAFVLVSALYLVQGFYYARVLVPAQDGINYLLLGAKAVTGEIGVYDDRVVGNRLPLPFYVLGLTQVKGPNLLAARWLNVGFGFLSMILAAAVARRLAGDAAGLLAALFLTTQGVVVAYFAYEGYPAFAAFCLTLALCVLVGGDSPTRRLLGTALIGLLFFVRSNLWPVIPLTLAHSVWRAKRRAERILLAAVIVLPPLIFLSWNPNHLKLLAYVPVLRGLVAPLGFVSALTLDERQILGPAAQVWAVAQVVRRYEFWVLAGVVLVLATLWRVRSGSVPFWLTRQVQAVAGLFLLSTLSLFIMYPWNFRWIGLYFLPYAPLAAILLGVGYAGLLAETPARSWGRWALVVVLVVTLVPPLYFVRNPLLPIGTLRAQDPFARAHAAAAHLRRAVPPDAKVFFYGSDEVYYLSGLPATYLQQVYMSDQFVRAPVDDWVARRSGFVTVSDMRLWLSSSADYAVIAWQSVPVGTPESRQPEKEMLSLIGRHFELIDTIPEYPFYTYSVYRRKRPGS